MILLWAAGFAAIGVAALILTRAATPGIPVVVNSSLPNPTNLRTYVDDQTVTVTWDAPSNAAANNIVGYYITWGTQSSGVYTNAKQTIKTVTQIQPLQNGTTYNIKVQSVQGYSTTVPTPGAHSSESAQEYRANGQVSTGITATMTPSSARVDQLRTQMTGFFDDFNRPAGGFDELKWNAAGAACNLPGATGSFINNQFHAHTQTASTEGNEGLDEGSVFCDRSQTVNRPRAVFDITGRTEANPGVITFDFDGVTMGRDVWYIDLMPANARTNGSPIDVTSHSSVFNDDPSDPSMLRFVQKSGDLSFVYYDSNKAPQQLVPSFVLCPDHTGFFTRMNYCSTEGRSIPGMSPLPEMPFPGDNDKVMNVANVRQHYRIEISPTKIKLFLNSVRLYEASMPSTLASTTKYIPHVTLFSYTTGKDTPANPTTSILHWDNFGFNGPASPVVVHNYIEGGTTGTIPYLGRGTIANQVPRGARSTRINIPDSIGSPTKARVMFNVQAFGYQVYNWSSSDHIILNGQRYNVPSPQSQQLAPYVVTDGVDSHGKVPLSMSIDVNSSDLRQGMNDLTLNINATGILNVHAELEYNKGSEPAFTQPSTIFGTSTFNAAFQPIMTAHDSYLFVEQDLGLPSGVIDSGTSTPPPSGNDTTAPTVTLTAPANNTTVANGASFTASANASDNVGVTKVEFYISNALAASDTTSPYSSLLSTADITAGVYSVRAVAYDAANNQTTSNTVTITISPPPAPTVTISANPNSILTGTATTLNWSSTNSSTCTASGSWSGSKATSGSQSTGNLTANQTYTLSCTGAGGSAQNSASVTVTATPPPGDTTAPTVTMSLVGQTLTSGQSSIIIKNQKSVTWQPLASDASGIKSLVLTVNGSTVALTSGSYIFGSQPNGNGDYIIRAVATDNADNVTTSTLTVKLRHPDINRSGRVDLGDLTGMMLRWNQTSTNFDIGGAVNGMVDLADLTYLMQRWNSTQ